MESIKRIYNIAESIAESIAKLMNLQVERIDIQAVHMKLGNINCYAGYMYTADNEVILIREDGTFEKK
ncbi:MAG: hypothetical protein IKO68_08200 [Oscillospiraceae bacterium]|nr:hypothetical protein [Oscillospiraceae bacterium]